MLRPTTSTPSGNVCRLLGGLGLLVVLTAAPARGDVTAAADHREPSGGAIAAGKADVDALVRQLGDDNYATRAEAARRLEQLGPAAIDPLLDAAERSTDLEIALQARWLAYEIPLTLPGDHPTARSLLGGYKQKSFPERVRVMRRLLRLDDDAGIEPLARLVRLERAAAGSRMAAAFLAAEWEPDTPYFRGFAQAIRRGLGASRRPAAAFLQAVVDATLGESGGIDRAAAALADLATDPAGTATFDNDQGGGMVVALEEAFNDDGLPGQTQLIFRQCLIEMLLAAGRHEEATAQAVAMLTESLDTGDDPASLLAWCVQRGLPGAVKPLRDRLLADSDDRRLLFAVALADRAAGQIEEARRRVDRLLDEELSDREGYAQRLTEAVVLGSWGAEDWADRCYRKVVTDPPVDPKIMQLVSMASTYYSEFLHDLGRDAEAAEVLSDLLEGKHTDTIDLDNLMRSIGRDTRSIRSRAAFFQACAARARGDSAGERAGIEKALAAYPKDVDALIALYRIPDERQRAVTRIEQALREIDDEIAALPDEANSYNEYAWLVANTVGDRDKATGYSRRSLELSFDNASYLDTLAHCLAAEGRYEAAVRTQRLAARYEPHNHTIDHNLARFKKLADEHAGGEAP